MVPFAPARSRPQGAVPPGPGAGPALLKPGQFSVWLSCSVPSSSSWFVASLLGQQSFSDQWDTLLRVSLIPSLYSNKYFAPKVTDPCAKSKSKSGEPRLRDQCQRRASAHGLADLHAPLLEGSPFRPPWV